jgi:hypothetical protein
MKLNEVIAKYGNQEVDESKIKEVLGVKNIKFWEPSFDEYYFYYTGSDVHCTHFTADIDQELFMIGNCFKTKEEAEFARDKQIFLTKFERYLRENEDEPVDWKNSNQDKFSILFQNKGNLIRPSNWCLSQFQGAIYTTNEKALQAFIKDNEADIKKYMFGVK